jgi:trehalose/maltose hydrolase-like predicted phosphorylase
VLRKMSCCQRVDMSFACLVQQAYSFSHATHLSLCVCVCLVREATSLQRTSLRCWFSTVSAARGTAQAGWWISATHASWTQLFRFYAHMALDCFHVRGFPL